MANNGRAALAHRWPQLSLAIWFICCWMFLKPHASDRYGASVFVLCEHTPFIHQGRRRRGTVQCANALFSAGLSCFACLSSISGFPVVRGFVLECRCNARAALGRRLLSIPASWCAGEAVVPRRLSVFFPHSPKTKKNMCIYIYIQIQCYVENVLHYVNIMYNMLFLR